MVSHFRPPRDCCSKCSKSARRHRLQPGLNLTGDGNPVRCPTQRQMVGTLQS